ncbi:MAG: OmpA family protein, partial [Acidimicrobiia bacterium]|nr:OmpA family protein [Acidimicrobiia bacterium]
EILDEDLVVKPGLPSERDWLPSVLGVVARAGEDLEEGTVLANADLSFVMVAGEVETRTVQVAVLNDVRDILSALTFDFTSGVTVATADPLPTTTAIASGTSTTTAPPSTTTTLPPIVVEFQGNLDELIEGKVVEFEFGSSVITAEGRTLLDEVLEALREFPDIRVEIGGHTDDIGSDESNLVLSRLRATAVLSYLVDQGESPGRFQIVGYGESQPVADNSTEEGRARNRRIEFTALAE